MSERPSLQHTFLRDAGWGDARVTPLAGDASTRAYARLALNGQSALLMDQPQAAEAAAAAPDADDATRRRLGYNALARLAGPDCRRFAQVADYLSAQGLAAPRILAADYRHGLLLLEDLGDRLFTDAIAQGGPQEELYSASIEVLARLHLAPAPIHLPGGLPLFPYDELALIAETDLMLEWFLPLALGRAATEMEQQEHRALWRAVLTRLARAPVLVHRDFHAQNLLWLPERKGLQRVGLIDFQDAVAGSRAYDLVSLLEDARRDVPPGLAHHETRHYLDLMRGQGTALDEDQFRAEMAVMAAQRNTKIVGIFARLFARDGKRRYLGYLPRVWRYLENDFRHPLLKELATWYERILPRARRPLPEREQA